MTDRESWCHVTTTCAIRVDRSGADSNVVQDDRKLRNFTPADRLPGQPELQFRDLDFRVPVPGGLYGGRSRPPSAPVHAAVAYGLRGHDSTDAVSGQKRPDNGALDKADLHTVLTSSAAGLHAPDVALFWLCPRSPHRDPDTSYLTSGPSNNSIASRTALQPAPPASARTDRAAGDSGASRTERRLTSGRQKRCPGSSAPAPPTRIATRSRLPGPPRLASRKGKRGESGVSTSRQPGSPLKGSARCWRARSSSARCGGSLRSAGSRDVPSGPSGGCAVLSAKPCRCAPNSSPDHAHRPAENACSHADSGVAASARGVVGSARWLPRPGSHVCLVGRRGVARRCWGRRWLACPG